jgi:peroxiredoxin Q/BCP
MLAPKIVPMGRAERIGMRNRTTAGAAAGSERGTMKWIVGLGALAAVAIAATSAGAEGEAPKVGDRAPNFKLVGTDGKTYTLDQFQGKSAVVIAFYPKALTGG